MKKLNTICLILKKIFFIQMKYSTIDQNFQSEPEEGRRKEGGGEERKRKNNKCFLW